VTVKKELAQELSLNYEKESLLELAKDRGLSGEIRGKKEIIQWLLDNGLTWKDYTFTIDHYTSTRTKICRFFGIREGMKVLDIGAGPGGTSIAAANLMKNKGKIIAIDYLKYMVKEGRKKAKWTGTDNIIEFRVGDINDIDLGDDIFDIALLVYAPQHVGYIKDLETILSKIKNYTGRIGIADYHTVPRNFAQSVYLLRMWFYCDGNRAMRTDSRNINRLYHPDEIKQALNSTGWKITSEKIFYASPKERLTQTVWKHNSRNFIRMLDKITDPTTKEITISRLKTIESLMNNKVMPAQLDSYAILAKL
jgi:ubiquinone/menaquinone biosynthesis C-methylase UbiE